MSRLHARQIPSEKRSVADIPVLVEQLRSRSGVLREQARGALVAIGQASVGPLVKALSDPDEQVRWEAANALGCLRDRSAAPALVAALGDPRDGVRWLAAEGLIALRYEALESLLKALLQPRNVTLLGEASRHVLRVLSKRVGGTWLAPLVAAFKNYEPEAAVPTAAFAALGQFRMIAAAGAAGRPMPGSVVGRTAGHSQVEGVLHAKS
jgi:HEAT repeat protein